MNSIKQNILLELRNGRQFLNAKVWARLHEEIIDIKQEKLRKPEKRAIQGYSPTKG